MRARRGGKDNDGVTAIILAAGVARRLAPLTDHTQKSLLPVGGRPILARMLAALSAAGVPRAAVVVGHCAGQVRSLVGSLDLALDVSFIDNPDYQRGSVLSLLRAADLLRAGPALIMDADVVFPVEMLTRLLAEPAPNALLRDRGFKDTGEEVKVYARAGRVIGLGKKFVPAVWDDVGEGVGFFRCAASAGPPLVRLLERVARQSDGSCEYEDALHLLVRRHLVAAVDVTGLPWTEVDFVEDLRHADARVAPAIDARETA